MAKQAKKRSMIADIRAKISENPKKKTQIQHSDEGKRSKKEKWGHCLDLCEVWSCNYCLPPVGAIKQHETERLTL